MPTKKITDDFCNKVKFIGERVDYYDSEIKGLILRVGGKKKTFAFKYRQKGTNKRPVITIGEYPTIKSSFAKIEAKKLAGNVAQGKDPRTELALASTLENFFWKDYWRTKKSTLKESVQVDTERMMKNHILPVLGHIPLNRITFNDCNRFHLNTLKTCKHGTATNRIRKLKAILNYAISMNYIDKNPTDGIQLKSADTVNRYLEDYEKSRFMMEYDDCQGTDYEEIADMLLFAYYTGIRKGEIESLKWSNFHTKGINNGMARLEPDVESTKTGIQKSQVIPKIARKLIEKRYKLSGLNDRESEKKIFNLSNPTREGRKFMKRAKIHNFRPFHDLRHNHASDMLSQGFTLDDVRDQLDHKSYQTTLRYAHLKDEVRIDRAEKMNTFYNSK